ncbi:unnamed protein product [Cylicocyclus nassatus]|uniref:Metalloendopeptidase n=1 Tax=Cylicocyclus nassatus TaxID=53992 RepID=A0AA36MF49_CYLNA|nr:unnamed protein product [Cylicocyclus nassatus]
MRVNLLLILVSYSAADSIIQRIDKALSDVPTTLNKAELLANYETIHAHEPEIEQQLQQSPQQVETLHRLEEEVRPIQHNEYGLDTIDYINKQSPLGDLLYQSDIILSTEQARRIAESDTIGEAIRRKRQAINTTTYDQLWPKGKVPYSFSLAIDEDRVEVVQGDGCTSYVARLPNEVQQIFLGDSCRYIGTVAHEIGHTLGLWHTHARHDRDEYLVINLENIPKADHSQFRKETTRTSDNHGVPFDYGSIMNYAAKGWMIPGLEKQKDKYAMYPKDVNYVDTLGSHFVSFYDKLILNRMYKCLGNCEQLLRSPEQERLKRQVYSRFESSFSGSRGISGLRGSQGSRFMNSIGGNGGSNTGGSNAVPLPGMEGGSNPGGGGIIEGSNVHPLPGSEGGSNPSGPNWWNDWWNHLPDWLTGLGWDLPGTISPPPPLFHPVQVLCQSASMADTQALKIAQNVFAQVDTEDGSVMKDQKDPDKYCKLPPVSKLFILQWVTRMCITQVTKTIFYGTTTGYRPLPEEKSQCKLAVFQTESLLQGAIGRVLR